jgi:rhamnogalacturonyl hydrolase YesR
MADRQWEDEPYGPRFPRDGDKNWKTNVAAGLSWQTRYWIDDMFMITMAQSQAYRATGDRRYIERAALEAVAYLERLQRPNGLFYHAPEAPHHWACGNGWMAVGMAELLRFLPSDSPHRARILSGYRAMMAALLAHQDASGMWHQIIDGPDSWPESSGTAMFTYAFITGVQLGLLDEKIYGPAARRGWLALTELVDANANLREVCVGTSATADRNYYLKRARAAGDFHGQAPLLWCAAGLLR